MTKSFLGENSQIHVPDYTLFNAGGCAWHAFAYATERGQRIGISQDEIAAQELALGSGEPNGICIFIRNCDCRTSINWDTSIGNASFCGVLAAFRQICKAHGATLKI